MGRLSKEFNPHVAKAHDEYHEQFLHVLYQMQVHRIVFHNGAGPRALGITKKQFDQRCTDLAAALWRKTMFYKQAATESPAQNIVFYEYLANFSNIYEALEVTKADMQSDRTYAVLGLTREQFREEARFAAHTVLRDLKTYAEVSKTGGQATFEQVVNCLKLGGIDPEQDDTYQSAGYASHADLLEQLENWVKAAEARRADQEHHHCCGGHNHTPEPTPSS